MKILLATVVSIVLYLCCLFVCLFVCIYSSTVTSITVGENRALEDVMSEQWRSETMLQTGIPDVSVA